ncbi:hypothetical protein PHJA_002837000 [Phtheirospermum japonicum]|uniref:Avr9/Cf-9 rapidly elicited protein 146 n=1 Tax=Phtheirospermum japonicum TaxID=374723 RepID=A0A830D6P0_9LAMI|nr:hypothetical protein PHJA_002837000 [Phtheirospermum japonicum]
MEQNLPIVAKKFWNIVRVIYFMLRKGIISKGKLLADLNTIMKRGKIAGKAAVHNLMMFHHHHIAAAAGRRSHDRRLSFPADDFHLSKRSKNHSALAPSSVDGELVSAALEMMIGSAAASPALPGFGRTPMVRQLRITDSPFPMREVEEGNYHVDEAAEEFIVRFYKDLKRQNEMGYLGYS